SSHTHPFLIFFSSSLFIFSYPLLSAGCYRRAGGALGAEAAAGRRALADACRHAEAAASRRAPGGACRRAKAKAAVGQRALAGASRRTEASLPPNAVVQRGHARSERARRPGQGGADSTIPACKCRLRTSQGTAVPRSPGLCYRRKPSRSSMVGDVPVDSEAPVVISSISRICRLSLSEVLIGVGLRACIRMGEY
ncbi:unnamed protein product, partial [Urochloa humidicola]